MQLERLEVDARGELVEPHRLGELEVPLELLGVAEADVAPKGLLFKVFCYGPGMDGFQKAFVASALVTLVSVTPVRLVVHASRQPVTVR